MMEGKNGFANLSTRKIKASLSTQKNEWKYSITIMTFFKHLFTYFTSDRMK